MTQEHLAIQTRGLTKKFRVGVRLKVSKALLGLDLDVPKGEVFGFLGPNGAGKTTTIKILVGLLRPDSGSAKIFGHTLPDVRVRKRLAYLPELPDFYDYLRPGEFLTHCGKLFGMDSATLRQRVPKLLERVGLEPNEKRPMRKFSKGMLQRCGIAQAMLPDPDLYILDEPMGGLDPLGRRWVKDLIGELSQQGKTVFFSSHVLAEAEAVCHRVAFLNKGKLIAQGPTMDFLGGQVGTWEILVVGDEARKNEQVKALVEEVRPAGPDTLLILANHQQPEQVLPTLAQRGHKLRGVERRHTSLEDVFIRLVNNDSVKNDSEGATNS